MPTLRLQSVAAILAGTLALSSAGIAQSGPTTALSAKAKAQIDSVRRAVAKYDNPQSAEDAGYQPVFGMVPLQGVHYVKPELIRNGSFELTQPSVLMYAPIGDKPTLVGVAYAYENARSKAVPEGFDGPGDDWHAHDELSRNPDERIVMVHLWLTDAPEGPFARYNPYLPYMAASLERPSARELTAKTARGERARRFAFALAIATHPPQLFDMLESRGGEALTRAAYPHRRALMATADTIKLAEKRRDKATYERMVTQALAHSDALISTYRTMAASPRAQALINKGLDELMGIGHEGHHSMPGTKPQSHTHP